MVEVASNLWNEASVKNLVGRHDLIRKSVLTGAIQS